MEDTSVVTVLEAILEATRPRVRNCGSWTGLEGDCTRNGTWCGGKVEAGGIGIASV
jgi:hypothetical protein